MKLSLDQHAQLRKMARYFESVERLAERLGLEAGAFVEEFRNYHLSNKEVRNNLLGIVSRRRSLIQTDEGKAVRVVQLEVIVNEERF